MANAVTTQHCCSKMIGIPSLATMRPYQECIEPSLFPPDIERGYIRKEVVDPVAIWGVLFCIPRLWPWKLPEKSALGLALIVDAIEADNPLQEYVEFGVT